MKNIYIIILCLLLPKLVIAQSPGGVSTGLKAWYKADTYTSQPTGWADASNNNKNLLSGGALPTWTNGNTIFFNFNPYFNFTAASGNYFYTPAGIMGTNTTPGSFFTVGKITNPPNFLTVVGFGDDDPNLAGSVGGSYGPRRDNVPTSEINIGSNIGALPAHIPNYFWNASGGNQVQLNGSYSGVNNVGGDITDNLFAIGSEAYNVPGVGSELYAGGIPEVIVYNQNLANTTDAQKINTYLAVKYGVTLSHNYLSSGGTTVYNVSTYGNNVAGIAKDDASGLHQKQSMSVNSGSQVLISTTGVANTNQANTVGLNDGQFLVWGDNNLSKTLSTALVKTLPTGDVTNCFAAIWKVQNTGTVGTVRVMWPAGSVTNLHLVQSTDATFDTSDTFTSMSATQPINGKTYAYADVSLGNGSYFTFAGYQPAPGGVLSGLKFWHKADVGITTSGSNITNWNDSSPNGLNIGQMNTAALPQIGTATTTTNFNPYVNFTANNQVLGQRTMSSLGTNQFEVYTALGTYDAVNGIVTGIGKDNLSSTTDNWDSPHQWASGDFTHTGVGGGAGLTSNQVPQSTSLNTRPLLNHFRYDVSNHSKSMNGSIMGPPYSLGTTNNTAWTRGGHYVGANNATNSGMGGNDRGMIGQLSEVFLYEKVLTNTERQKVYTYLAIKNGVTLRSDLPSGGTQTGTYDYMNSGGTVIWDGTSSSSAYHNNVAGIARDIASGLNQKQSMSVNSGSQVLISTTGIADTNQANTVGLSDGQFLVWGDNNLAKTLSTALVATLPAGKVNNRFAAIWKVQNTGTVGTVRVMWPVGITNLHLVQSADATFDASDTFTSMSATQTINGKTYAYADVTLAGTTSYFTFAGLQSAPGGVLLPDVWLRADVGTSTTTNNASVAEWDNYGASGGKAVQLDTPYSLPTFTQIKHNFNPAITDNTNGTAGNGAMKLLGVYPTQANRNLESYVLMSQSSFSTSNNTIIDYTSNSIIGGNNSVPRFYFNSTTDLAFWWTGSADNSINATGITRTAGMPYISGYSLPTSSTTRTWLLNGKTGTSSSASGVVGQNLFIFADSNGNDNSGGDMSEIVTYSKVLTTTEKARVNSYLAIKYGITYLNDAGTGTQDYLNTDGNKVWTNLVNYQNNVFGIGRDDASALHQRISSSVNSSTLTVSTDANFTNANSAHTNIDTDKQFLIFGDNNGAVAFSGGTAITATDGTIFSDSEVLARRWKVQDFGGVDCVNLRFNNALFTTLTGTTKYYIIAADNAAFTQNVRYKEVSAVSNNIDIMINFGDNTSTTPSGGNYFTIARKNLGITKADLPPVIGINTITSISSWQLSSKNTYLEINSNSKGLIVSRVANTSAITLPITGMLIYDLSDNSFKVYTGTAWRKLSGSGDTTIFCN